MAMTNLEDVGYSQGFIQKNGQGGQNNTYGKNWGAKEVRATVRLLGGSGGMLPQKFFEFYTL